METRKRKMDNNANNEEKNPTEELEAKIMHLQKSVDDIQKSQNEKNEKILEELRKSQKEQDEKNYKILKELRKSQKEQEEVNKKILEKLENQQKLILEELRKSKENEESEVEKRPSFNSVISLGSLVKNTPNNGSPLPVGKSFVLKHKFNDVSKFAENLQYHSGAVMHFGVPWSIIVEKKEQHLGFYLHCRKSISIGNWSIDAEFTLKAVGGKGMEFARTSNTSFGTTTYEAHGNPCFLKWDTLLADYVVDDKLTAEIHVKIKNTNGIYKKNLRCFDESMKEVSDVTLVVGEQKFYVSKLYLATHSPYFRTLFLGHFQESNKSEIKLSGINAEDFQNFLEILYGDPSIDEITVEGILLIADMYDTPTIVKKCEDFLLEKSEKSTKEKLEMAIRYNLNDLKKKCMSEIKTVADIKSVIPGNPADLDHSICAELLGKAISFQS